jgi:transcriptional regulator with XRE-family HTH domain
MDLVLRLRELRRASGLSQDVVAARASIGVKTLSSFETGARIASMKLSQLHRLLSVYGITEAEFFGPPFACRCDPLADQTPLEEAVVTAFTALSESNRAVVYARITFTFVRPWQPDKTTERSLHASDTLSRSPDHPHAALQSR